MALDNVIAITQKPTQKVRTVIKPHVHSTSPGIFTCVTG